jgi:RNA polymerase sigma-70 factor (ECF subfamily)
VDQREREARPVLHDLSDAVLVERALDDDIHAFDALVRRHSSFMRAYVYRIVGSLADTDDVIQEAFVTAWRQLPQLRDPDAVRAWLIRIAGREALALVRKRPADRPLDRWDSPAVTGLPEQSAIRSAQLRALSDALDKLTDEQRRCWILREVAELSYAEMAEEMEMSTSTVRGLLARARASIAIQMEGWR